MPTRSLTSIKAWICVSITEEPVPTVMPARSRSAERPALRIAGVPVRAFKGGLFVLGLVPVARWMVLGLYDRLGANPVEFLIRSAGTWTFVCLLLTLAVTPLRIVTRQHA